MADKTRGHPVCNLTSIRRMKELDNELLDAKWEDEVSRREEKGHSRQGQLTAPLCRLRSPAPLMFRPLEPDDDLNLQTEALPYALR
ncbi:hypothetical protein GGX14DRAFT_569596 [Mycena pura]|uniref:Uncharacterized protein n=1 Tax=Mycena pura TaxID=153505 RepID=A0AAD6VAR6_9AGAR|nr:hypothetical protein GGX14DRAFT_569596 [Mycena pura]